MMQTQIYFFRRAAALFLALLLFASAGCAAKTPPSEAAAPTLEEAAQPAVFSDAVGSLIPIRPYQRVVSLYGSFAEVWLLAGGTLVGTTDDAIEERSLELGSEIVMIGSVKEPNLEEILALEPDLVILSADIANQLKLDETLTQAGIVHAYFRMDAFEDYLHMLEICCRCTDRMDLYETYGTAVRSRIDAVLQITADQPAPAALLLRAYSTGIKAKGADNLAGVILRDLGADNPADRGSVLEDISLEEILAADPDFIFITTMGKEDSALAYLSENFETNPAWASLSAVRNGQVIVLPKELFHYKPNARWGESYETLAKYLYPQLAADIG